MEQYIAKTIIVALDFDDVIAMGAPAKIKHAKLLHGIDTSKDQILKETYPLGPKKYKELIDEITIKQILDFGLAEGCKEVLESLTAQGFQFAVVTSRYAHEFQASKDFCKYHNLPIEYLHNTNYKPKEFFCRKLHARAMMDWYLKQTTGAEKRATFKILF